MIDALDSTVFMKLLIQKAIGFIAAGLSECGFKISGNRYRIPASICGSISYSKLCFMFSVFENLIYVP